MEDYFDYLQKRNPLSDYYRKFILYPKYKSLLSGKGLEVGCGLGEFLESANNFEGIDINEKIVSFCQDKGLQVCLGNAYEIPFSDSSFDCVLLDNVFEHLDEPTNCLNEIKRILVDNGKVLLIVPNQLGWDKDSTHVIYWDENNLPEELQKNGFKILEMQHFPIPSKKLGNLFWPHNTFFVLAQKTHTSS